MKNYIKEGKTMKLIAPAGGVTSGVGYVIGNLFVVSQDTVAAGAEFIGITEGVFQLPKNGTDTGSQGGRVWWDDTAKVCRTATATGRFEIGQLANAATSGPTTTIVRLNGTTVTAAP